MGVPSNGKERIDYGVAPMPKLPNGQPMKTFVGVKGWHVTSFSKQNDLATKFTEWVTNEENAKIRFEKTKEIPPVKSVMEDPIIKDNEVAKAVATQSENGIPMPNIPEMQEVWKPAGDALQLVVTDKEAPKAALDSAVKQIKGNIEANHNKKNIGNSCLEYSRHEFSPFHVGRKRGRNMQTSMEPANGLNHSKHRKMATMLSIIPGVGQMYNKQFVKGLIFLVLTGSFIVAFADLLNMGLWGIVTLGTEVPRDHSVFLLVEGILALIVIAFGLGIYAFNLYDAYQNGKKRDIGTPLNSVKEQYRNLLDQGFPYLMVSPGFLLLIFVVVFPIIFVILIGFTNYDLYHSPPAKLVDWVGFKNFIDIFTLPMWRETFVSVFSWTVIWTFVATTLQVALGIFLAIIVNQPGIKGKAIIRTIFILPWAVPAFVSILVFSGMFNETFGAINNQVLALFGIEKLLG